MDGHIIFCDRAGPKHKVSHLHGPVLFSPHYTKQDDLHILSFSRNGTCPLPSVNMQFPIQASKYWGLLAHPQLRGHTRSFVLLQTCVSTFLSNLGTTEQILFLLSKTQRRQKGQTTCGFLRSCGGTCARSPLKGTSVHARYLPSPFRNDCVRYT